MKKWKAGKWKGRKGKGKAKGGRKGIKRRPMPTRRLFEALQTAISRGGNLAERGAATRNGEEKKNSKWLEYEHDDDARMMQNQTFCTAYTYIGFASEKKSKFNKIITNKEYKHVILNNIRFVLTHATQQYGYQTPKLSFLGLHVIPKGRHLRT